MKRITSFLLVLCMAASMAACSKSDPAPTTTQAPATIAETVMEVPTETETPAETESETSEEDTIDDDGWDTLAAMGEVQTENGLLTVTMTLPQELVGEGMTQESLDAQAGETFISAKLNEDGSVTYRLTKRQHKNMMDATVQSMDDALAEMANSDDFAISEIKHNKDFTQFDVYLETKELGLNETFGAFALYLYGGMYGIFTGNVPEHVIVNFYDPAGNLIESADSADMAE